jgi:hypothetical protein
MEKTSSKKTSANCTSRPIHLNSSKTQNSTDVYCSQTKSIAQTIIIAKTFQSRKSLQEKKVRPVFKNLQKFVVNISSI